MYNKALMCKSCHQQLALVAANNTESEHCHSSSGLTSHEHIKWEHALIQMVKRKRGNISTIDKVDVDLSRTSCDPKCSNVRS